jgi:hypothetical protein
MRNTSVGVLDVSTKIKLRASPEHKSRELLDNL